MAIKLALAPVSIETFFLLPSNFIPITEILDFLSSSAALLRGSLFTVLVCLSFLELRLTLSLEEAFIGTVITAVSLKIFFRRLKLQVAI